VEFAGKVLVQMVLSAINAVSRFLNGGMLYLVTCRLRLVSDVKIYVEIMISLLDKLDCLDKFCYLGEGGGAQQSLGVRVRCAWAKFRGTGSSTNIKRSISQSESMQGLYSECLWIGK